MSNFQKRYSTQTVKPNRRQRIQPAPPIRCVIDGVEQHFGIANLGTFDQTLAALPAIFPSRNKAKKALAKLVRVLPPKETADQPKRYSIRNI